VVEVGEDDLRSQPTARACRVLSNFSISFTVISVLTGVTTLHNTGLTFGGPATMTLGWFVAGAFTMAEICSALPTSGDLYYWSPRLSGDRWAPFASWITGWYFHCYLSYPPCIIISS
jgi:amino acid transporter